MSSRAIHLAIDARPRGPRGLLAAEVVLGRTMLGHLLDLALELAPDGEPVVVHARPEEHRELRELVGDRARARRRLRDRAAPGRRRRPADRSLLRRGRGSDAGCAAAARRSPPCSGGSTGPSRSARPTRS